MSLRDAAQQALEALEKEARSFEDWLNMMQAARTSLRAALVEDALQRLTDVQQEIEAVTDCHEKGGDKLPPPSDDIPDATKMVEPVAYVSGYFDGKCVIKPVEAVLFPIGMVLYRSPPTSQESQQVEPVAWMHQFEGVATLNTTPPKYYGDLWKHTALYAAPPKREPLTDEQIEFRFGRKPTKYMMFFIRSTERAHGIGGGE